MSNDQIQDPQVEQQEAPKAPKLKFALATDVAFLNKQLENHPEGVVILGEGLVITYVYREDHWFWGLPAFRTDRYFSDNKFIVASHQRQFLPYLQLLDYTKFEQTQDVEDIGIYMYKRGKAGDESRLHDLMSIGVGGHVEGEVNSQNSLRDVLALNVTDEVKEEVGYDIPLEDVQQIMARGFFAIIDSRAPTEIVHLGLAMSIGVDPSKINDKAEEGIINEGRFIRLGDLMEGALNGTYVFEQWSKVVLAMLAKKLVKRFEDQAGDFLK